MMDNNEEVDERYKTGIVYKIVCNITGEVYIGSTHHELHYRFNKHKNDGTCSSQSIIKRGDCTPSIIEEYPCRNQTELRWRERHYYDTMECVNDIRPIVTKEETRQKQNEWHENNKEHCAARNAKHNAQEHVIKHKQAQGKKYREENQEAITAYHKKYREDNAEKLIKDRARYYQDNIVMVAAKHKAYQEKNKAEIKVKRAADYQKLKANITNVICGCGGKYKTGSGCKTRHEKTKKHLKWIADGMPIV